MPRAVLRARARERRAYERERASERRARARERLPRFARVSGWICVRVVEGFLAPGGGDFHISMLNKCVA